MASSSSMHFVSILRCADQCLYVGETSDLELRLSKHNEGTASVFTARRRPVDLAHFERFVTRREALQRERQLKRWTRANKEALIARNIPVLKQL